MMIDKVIEGSFDVLLWKLLSIWRASYVVISLILPPPKVSIEKGSASLAPILEITTCTKRPS
jgi:uncharacterized membrane protein YqaE (UPF0057 family)